MEQLQKANKQPTISFDNGAQLRHTLDYMLGYGHPPSRCREPLFRAAHPLIKHSYEAHRAELMGHAVRRHNEAPATASATSIPGCLATSSAISVTSWVRSC